MPTGMSEDQWALVVDIFRAARSKRGVKGRDDRRFLEALHYFSVHNITWRALQTEFGPWNSVWKRFSRLSQAGTFETFLQILSQILAADPHRVSLRCRFQRASMR